MNQLQEPGNMSTVDQNYVEFSRKTSFEQQDFYANINKNKEFTRLAGVCYLDNAGSSLYSEIQVKELADNLCKNIYGNPHSGNQSSQLSNDIVEQVRIRVLMFFHTNPNEYSVIFTSGCTAALKLLAESFVFPTEKLDLCTGKCSLHQQKELIRLTGSCVDSGLPVNLTTLGSCSATNESSRCWCKQSHAGSLYYLEDNHTSVIGMRNLVKQRGIRSSCITHESVCDRLANGVKLVETDAHVNIKNKHECEMFVKRKCENCIGAKCNNLLVYPAQSNFNGYKYPLSWITEAKTQSLFCNCSTRSKKNGMNHGEQVCRFLDGCGCKNWFVCIDAASFVSTSPLNLSEYKPDFVAMSFYKIFGFPTGLGALLVKNSSANLLQRNYFGGGTVNVSITREDFCVLRDNISDRYFELEPKESLNTDGKGVFEDGTISFLSILALNSGFDALQRVAGSIKQISQRTFTLSGFVYSELKHMYHNNSKQAPVVVLYHNNNFDDVTIQGPIIAFNVLRSDGTFIGYNQVDKLAQSHDIHFRTGCFCNMGACQIYLGLSSQKIKQNFKAGHVCGDDLDLIDGQPTGCCRISFGYYSDLNDALIFLNFITTCFTEYESPCVPKQYLKYGDDIFKGYLSRIVSAESENHSSRSGQNDLCSQQAKDEACETEGDTTVRVNNKVNNIVAENFIHSKEDGILSNNINLLKSNDIEKEVGELVNIFVYPVKSCGAYEVSEWQIGPHGLNYDREWMVVGETGICLNQKREHQLCLIKPTIDTENNLLHLAADGCGAVSVSLKESIGQCEIQGSLCSSKVCGDRVSGQDCGDEVAQWLQQVLHRPGLRLIRQSSQQSRVNAKAGPENKSLSLANEAQYLLINSASCQALADHGSLDISETVQEMIGRFRANIVVSTTTAFEEDQWTGVCIGEQHFVTQGMCTRCQMIGVNQRTGEKSKQPLLALTKIRSRKMTFGILLNHQQFESEEKRTVLRVGDCIKVPRQIVT